MADTILISRKDPEFLGLLKDLVKGLRTGDSPLCQKVKTELLKSKIHLAFNAEQDKIEVLAEGCRPVVFDAKEFEPAK